MAHWINKLNNPGPALTELGVRIENKHAEIVEQQEKLDATVAECAELEMSMNIQAEAKWTTAEIVEAKAANA